MGPASRDAGPFEPIGSSRRFRYFRQTATVAVPQVKTEVRL
jgi:hypothetical protein